MHKNIVVLALIGAGLGLAQPKGITPEMINRSLPLEGAPLAVAGPYKVTSEPAVGAVGLMVYRPETLDAFPKKDTLPLMVWGNGGCAIDSTRYGGFMSTIASHGFLVMSTVPREGARQETAGLRHILAHLAHQRGLEEPAHVAAVGRASVLIPLVSADRHQEYNAGLFARSGAAEMRLQGRTTGEELARLILELAKDTPRIDAMEKSAARFARPDAVDRILAELVAQDLAVREAAVARPEPLRGGERRELVAAQIHARLDRAVELLPRGVDLRAALEQIGRAHV